MSFTGHAAVLLRPQEQDTDFKAATLPGKTFAAHWLKGSTLATLSLGVHGTEHLLALHIRDQAVIQCSSVLCTMLSPEDTGRGWVLLGAPTWSKPYQACGFAFSFAPAEAGRHCQTVMEEIRRIQASSQLTPPTQSLSGVHKCHMTSASGAAEQAFTPEALQPQAQPPGLPRTVDPAEVTEAKGHEHRRAPDESTTQHDAELIDLIKGYLQDPAFQEEVERVAQLWDRAEEELLAEHAAAGTDLETETNLFK